MGPGEVGLEQGTENIQQLMLAHWELVSAKNGGALGEVFILLKGCLIGTLNNMNLSTDSVLWGEKPTRHYFPSNTEQWEDIFGSRTVWTIANVTAMKPLTPLRYNFMIKLHPEDQK